MQGGRKNNMEMTSFPESFGFGNRGSLLSNFFDHHSFNDPFFTRPFGSIFDRAFGSDAFFRDPFGERGVFNQGYQPPHQGPVIEELPDDHEDTSASQLKTSEDPIVEHPDDDENQGHRRKMQSRSQSGFQGNNYSNGRQAPFKSFSFHSSSVTYGGPNGAYYTTSTTRRAGPDGVIEEEHREADSPTGNATQKILRGIGDKGRSFTKNRNSDGKIDTMETLHNLNEDEIAQFDEDWERRAEKSLPGWEKYSVGMLDEGLSGKRTNALLRPALPSNELYARKEEKRHNEANGRKKEGQSQKNLFSRKWFGQGKD